MANFLNTSSTYAQLEDTLTHTKNELTLISPYIDLPQNFFERLKYADKNNIKITIVCREKDLNPEVKNELKTLNNLELRFLDNLHAKCFYNEFSMVIGSLNLYEYSIQNNREMGVLFTIQEDPELFKAALDEAKFILSLATIYKASKLKDAVQLGTSFFKDVNKILNKIDTFSVSDTSPKLKGHCIRCATNIPLNIEKPYCSDCYRIWEKHNNSDFKENYCHVCRTKISTTLNKPSCYSCFKKLSK